MTFYIRPRQDLSLSSLAAILLVLEAELRTYRAVPVVDAKTGKPAMRIYLFYDDVVPANGAISAIAEWTHRNISDFKLVEVGPEDYDPFREELYEGAEYE